MPKSRTKQQITRTHKRAQKTAASPAAAASSSEGRGPSTSQVDETVWRASIVREDAKISKTLALQQYRLKPQDLDGLAFTKKHTRVSGYSHDMFLYKEREVERRAWERHGGLEGFDAYLTRLRERHASKKGESSPFVQPASYGAGSGNHHRDTNNRDKNPMCIYPNVVPPWEPYDETAISVERARIEQAMPPWLWDACTRALNDLYQADLIHGWLDNVLSEGGRWDELSPMKAALDVAPMYPARPSERLPSSPSVDTVRAVLACAARAPEAGVGYGKPVDGLADIHSCWPDPVDWYDWSVDYLERLFAAILEVIEEHGVGVEGWESLRWEVYDKYAESLRCGVKYDSEARTWSDCAAQWLDGRLVGRDLDSSCRGKCGSGRELNGKLPSTESTGLHSIGVLCRYGCIQYMYYCRSVQLQPDCQERESCQDRTGEIQPPIRSSPPQHACCPRRGGRHRLFKTHDDCQGWRG